jgi:hypothetical protein
VDSEYAEALIYVSVWMEDSEGSVKTQSKKVDVIVVA